MLRNDKPYCETCFHELFGVVCIACKQFIMGTVLEVSNVNVMIIKRKGHCTHFLGCTVFNIVYNTKKHVLLRCKNEQCLTILKIMHLMIPIITDCLCGWMAN